LIVSFPKSNNSHPGPKKSLRDDGQPTSIGSARRTSNGDPKEEDLNFNNFNLGHGTFKQKRKRLEDYKKKILNDDVAYAQCQ